MIDDDSGGGLGGNYGEGGCNRDGFYGNDDGGDDEVGGKYGDSGGGRLVN